MSTTPLGEYSVRDTRGERPPHILVVAYLFPPCDAVNVRRPAALRNAFESLGVRTTVLASAISGRLPDDSVLGVIRAGDLRTRFETPYQALVGYTSAPIHPRTEPRWWTRFIVPDVTAVSWMPAALWHLRRLLRQDPPDGVLTTSPPESAHLLGAVARRAHVPWIADFRDGWRFDPPHPRPEPAILDERLERIVVGSADVVTAVNEPIASDICHRFGVRAIHVSNGFDRAALTAATDERATLTPDRFSIVYTGTLGIDAPERHDPHGGGARTFLAALRALVSRHDELRSRVELVVAGVTTSLERELLTGGPLRDVVRVLGPLPHARALGLQRAADGLLLIAGSGEATTGKVFEYLAVEKPIFALARAEGPAARLLKRAGDHTIASPSKEQQIEQALTDYIDRWTNGHAYRPHEAFDLDEYDFHRLGQRMLDLFVAAGALSRSDDSSAAAQPAAS